MSNASSQPSPPSQAPPSPVPPELEEFVFHSDQFKREIVPRKLALPEVVKFMLTRIDKATALLPLRQAEKVIVFYDVHEVGDHFKRLLDQREASAHDVLRSIVLTRIIARAGAPEDRQFAQRYYAYIVKHADSLPLIEEMVSLYDALGPESDAQPLREQVARRLRALEPLSESDPQAGLEYRKLEDFNTVTLERAVKAQAVKDRILKQADRRQRIDDEIKVYLTIQYGYSEYLQAWAARRLRQEVWADQPAQQTTRVDHPARRQEVAQAFRQAMNGLDQTAHLSPEAKGSLRIRCLRAIVFFGGTISAEEQQQVKSQAGMQLDILSNDVPL